jgi:hypothetical protein
MEHYSETAVERIQIAAAEVYPIDGPGIDLICAITHVTLCSGNENVLACADNELPVVYNVPAFATKAINEDIICAAIPPFPIMKGGLGKITDMGNI